MAKSVEIKMSQFAQPFMFAAIDLLKAVRMADYVPDEIREAADEFERVIEEGRTKL